MNRQQIEFCCVGNSKKDRPRGEMKSEEQDQVLGIHTNKRIKKQNIAQNTDIFNF